MKALGYIVVALVFFVAGLFSGLYLAGYSPAEVVGLLGEGTQDKGASFAIADENLEAVIRETLSQPSGKALTPADLARLRSLNAASQNISDISGIEHCTNLAWLYLNSNQISDISPLASLTNLNYLYLHDNQISDISPLVENSGLGETDTVLLKNNNLDLSEGSEDLEHIKQLEEKGVAVSY